MWLIGHNGQSYCFLELGVAKPQRSPSTARAWALPTCCSGAAIRWSTNRGWGRTSKTRNEDDALVLPLLRSFNNNRSQPSGLVLRFHKYTGRAEDALADRVIARTTVEWIGRRNVILDEIARLSRPARMRCRSCTPTDCGCTTPTGTGSAAGDLEALS